MADAARWAGRAGLAAAAIAMIATPLARRGRRAGLANVAVGGLATAAAGAAQRRWGGRRAAVAVATTTAITLAVERVGSTTGLPFGRYRYTVALRPQVAGVPAAVPAAWFAMALPAREAAHAALGDRSTRLARVSCGAALLTAWDLFLDPQMVGEGYWHWSRPGWYRGIPASNFVGWFATSLVVMGLLEATLPPGDPDPALVATYAGVTALHTLGSAAFFGEPVVAAVGGAATLAPAAVAVARLRRPRG